MLKLTHQSVKRFVVSPSTDLDKMTKGTTPNLIRVITMNFNNLPQDEAGRRMALMVELVALTELLVKFKHDDSVSSFVNGTIHNEIELIERCLEFGVDYVKAEMKEGVSDE